MSNTINKNVGYKRWKGLFVFCLGLALGTGFCMKWIESDFVVRGEKFNMFGLELFYSKEKVVWILSNLDEHARTALNNHLHFDFAFMAGIFPGISSLCMIARGKTNSNNLRRALFITAAAQLFAWAGDITENSYLIGWLGKPEIGNEFQLYRFIVWGKWVIGIVGFMFGIVMIRRRKGRKLDIGY